MKQTLKNIINFILNKCNCGGHYIAWSDRKSICDKCGGVE